VRPLILLGLATWSGDSSRNAGAGRGASGLGRLGRGVGSDRGERLITERAECVVAPARELACHRQHGSLVAEPGFDLKVVSVVGRGGSGSADGGFEQCPAQDTGALAGEMPAGASAVGGVDGDIEAGVTDGVSRGGKASAVAELRPDRDRDERTDSVVDLQRAASALRSREASEIGTEDVELVVDAIDRSQRNLDRRTSSERERGQIKATACRSTRQAGRGRRAMLEEDRMDTLQPGGAFVDERLVQADLGARVADVRGWNP
jgi:hypothetical protein